MCALLMDAFNGILPLAFARTYVCVCVCMEQAHTHTHARCDSYLFELYFSVTAAIRVNHIYREVASVKLALTHSQYDFHFDI